MAAQGAITPDPTAAPPTVVTPSYLPTYTREQETQMLEQQMAYLQSQLAAINQRIEELKK